MSVGHLRRMMYRFSNNKGPPSPLSMISKLPVDHPEHEKSCPFLHGIEMTCNKLKKSVRRREVMCLHVFEKAGCTYGHDFEQERLAAYDRLVEHREQAAEYKQKDAVVWRNEKGGWIGLK